MRNHAEFVTVELGKNGLPIRIFLSRKLACADPSLDIGEMRRGAAVSLIRKQIVQRSAGICECGCGKPVTEASGHMHERKPRGMTAHERGEISVENSIFIRPDCHVWGRNSAHANRRPQWGKR